MTGFDPSKFVASEPVRPVAEADDVDLGFDDLASGARKEEDRHVSASVPSSEGAASDAAAPSSPDPWDDAPATVAGVATVASLGADYPHAGDLNRMFAQPPPGWLRASLWTRLCADARKFVADGKCATALALGWQPIELFAFDARPWRRAFLGRQVWGTLGLVATLRGRGVGEIEEHRIEIINRIGAHERMYRSLAVMNRPAAALMWEAFDPANVPPANARLLMTGEIVDGATYQPP